MEAGHPHVVDPVDRHLHGHANLHGLFGHGKVGRSPGDHRDEGRPVIRALFRRGVDRGRCGLVG